jgi:multidrug efflux pump subunit AcrA (membrane-fusion protein)
VVPATIAPFFVTDLYAKDSGFVSEVLADIGDHVTKGQLLAVIDDPELAQQLASAQAVIVARQEQVRVADAAVAQAESGIEVSRQQLVSLEAEEKLMRATLKRQEELFAANGVTMQQMDEHRAKSAVAGAAVGVGKAKIAAAEADRSAAVANRSLVAAQVLVAEAELRRIQTLVQYTKVVAPYDGIITRRTVNPGDLAQAAPTARGSPLFTCQKIDTVRVMCDIPELSAAAVRPDVAAEVRLLGQGGRTIRAKVTRIATSIEPSSRTMRAEVDLPNPDESLRPGMYVQVTLTPQADAPKPDQPPRQ